MSCCAVWAVFRAACVTRASCLLKRQDEKAGKGYRVDVTHTYVVNTDFLEQARRVESQGLRLPSQAANAEASLRRRMRRLQSAAGDGFGGGAGGGDGGHGHSGGSVGMGDSLLSRSDPDIARLIQKHLSLSSGAADSSSHQPPTKLKGGLCGAACCVLCCAVLCCAVLCCAVLCCAVLCCAVLLCC